MTSKITPYNPLEKRNLAKSVCIAMIRQPATPLAEVPVFEGAGIYAIYYVGSFKPYAEIAERNRDGRFSAPIYVGKAIPSGRRKGSSLEVIAGRALSKRLQEHASSIESAENLALADFAFRKLVVDDIWIPLGESLLISTFSPVWNVLIDGFGNHDPGSGRYKGMRPRWDVLHPGRPWASKCTPRPEDSKLLTLEVESHFKNNPPRTEEDLESK